MRLIDADALGIGKCSPEYLTTAYCAGWNGVIDIINDAPIVDAVEVGNCKGCMWENRKRPQKCSCCRRNRDMKDCYDN